MSSLSLNEERAWNFGMTADDWIAFPVCESTEETDSTLGRLRDSGSFWNEVNRITWRTNAYINYFKVSEFEKHQHNRSSTKSGAEGAETFIQWKATFSTKQEGTVDLVSPEGDRVRVRPSEGSAHTWKVEAPLRVVVVAEGQQVAFGQVLVSAPEPIPHDQLRCNGSITTAELQEMLASRQRTRRFTGVKLARIRRDQQVESAIESLSTDPDEDVYVRLEAISYLVSVCDKSSAEQFHEYLSGNDEQNQLEAVIALGESGTEDSAEVLSQIVRDAERPYFLRSAAAWSLGQTGLESAYNHLMWSFTESWISQQWILRPNP